jgi:proteic killer suppression protein
VKITFADKKLEKLVNNDRKMLRELGKNRTIILRRRLSQLEDAFSLEDVRHLPGNYHELNDKRKGEWSCDLDQPYRLIFTAHEKPIPTNAEGQYRWSSIHGIEVKEIINYHKEK